MPDKSNTPQPEQTQAKQALDAAPRHIHSFFFHGPNCNFNPYLADYANPDFLEGSFLRGWLPESPWIEKATLLRIHAKGTIQFQFHQLWKVADQTSSVDKIPEIMRLDSFSQLASWGIEAAFEINGTTVIKNKMRDKISAPSFKDGGLYLDAENLLESFQVGSDIIFKGLLICK